MMLLFHCNSLIFFTILGAPGDTEEVFGSGYWSRVCQSSLMGSNAYTLVSASETLYAIATFYLGMDGHNRLDYL